MIRIAGVHKCYGRLTVLAGIDLVVPAGQVTAIVGPNASGKTTLIKMLLGLVRPDRGELWIDGVRVNGGCAYRARIGYMPQLARFPENLSARSVIRMLQDVRAASAEGAEELVREFALDAAMDRPLRTLSGGTRQRINAVLAFLFRPDLLILDEPTAGLDPVASSRLKDRVLRERGRGRTFIITSHVASDLEELADRVVFLLDGGIRFEGTPAELRALTGQSHLERAFAQLMGAGAEVPA